MYEARNFKKEAQDKFGCFRSSKPVLFSKELRDFIDESRSFQTLYAHNEGAYSKRIIRKGEEDYLKEFVYNTMFFKPGTFWRTEEDHKKVQRVELICEALMNLSYEYRKKGDITFSVAWVYLYEFNKSKKLQAQAIPVFIVYLNNNDRAIYLTVDLVSFENWDHFIDHYEFPESFLCLPRHGKYSFDPATGKLDLEFFTAPKHHQRNEPFISVKPFCHSIISYFNAALSSRRRETIKKICQFIFEFIWENKIPLICFLLELKTGNIYSDTQTALLMFLNSVRINSLKEFNFWKSPTSSEKCFTPLMSEESMEIIDRGRNFIALCKEPKKDWKQIFFSFCWLYRRCNPYLNQILKEIPYGPVKVIMEILNGIDMFLKGVLSVTVQNKPSHLQNLKMNMTPDYPGCLKIEETEETEEKLYVIKAENSQQVCRQLLEMDTEPKIVKDDTTELFGRGEKKATLYFPRHDTAIGIFHLKETDK